MKPRREARRSVSTLARRVMVAKAQSATDQAVSILGARTVRLVLSCAAHVALLSLTATQGFDALAPWNATLIVIEIFAYLFVQSSDPGYVGAGASGQGVAVSSEDLGDEQDDLTVGQAASSPLVPLEWSRRAWKPGAGIDDRLPAAPPTLKAWCTVCQLSPPLRSQHCTICDRCVAQYDHHNFSCSCVGEKNRARYFVWLACATGLLGKMLGDMNAAYTWTFDHSLGVFLRANAAFICASTLLWAVWLFFAFSSVALSCLAATNLTMYEITTHRWQLPYFRAYSMCQSPFSMGLGSNLVHFVGNDAVISRFFSSSHEWVPETVVPPGEPDPDTTSCYVNPWDNQYYSCC